MSKKEARQNYLPCLSLIIGIVQIKLNTPRAGTPYLPSILAFSSAKPDKSPRVVFSICDATCLIAF